MRRDGCRRAPPRESDSTGEFDVDRGKRDLIGCPGTTIVGWRRLEYPPRNDGWTHVVIRGTPIELLIVARLVLRWRHVANRFEQPPVIEPVDPGERSEFNRLKIASRVLVVESPPS